MCRVCSEGYKVMLVSDVYSIFNIEVLCVEDIVKYYNVVLGVFVDVVVVKDLKVVVFK